MSEPVPFWLNNKMSSGVKVAELAEQTLVIYRDKYYVVEQKAAITKAGRTLHYSRSSLPTIWKKVLRGETPVVVPPRNLVPPDEDILPLTTTHAKERLHMEQTPAARPANTAQEHSVSEPKANQGKNKLTASVKKADVKMPPQQSVTAHCPYCNTKQELSLDKGKNGKPFFVTCVRCSTDFAVRFVPVTMYQAQVAGFR